MAKRFKESKDGFKQLKLTSFGLKSTKSLNGSDEDHKENVKWRRDRANRRSSKIKEASAVINLDSDCSDCELPPEPTKETPSKVISVKKPTRLKTSCDKLEPRCLQRARSNSELEEEAVSINKRQLATRKVLFPNESANNNNLNEVAHDCSPEKKSRLSEDSACNKAANTKSLTADSSEAETELNKAESAVNKAESPTKKAESPTKKVESPIKKAESPIKKAESSIKKAESSTKKVESLIKKAESPTKKAESPTKKAESPTKKAESLIKEAESPTKKAESPTKKAVPNIAVSPSKQSKSPRRILSLRLRKDVFQSTEVSEEKTSDEGDTNTNNNSEEKTKNSEEINSNSSEDSLEVIRSQIAELSDINLAEYGIVENDLSVEPFTHTFEVCEEVTVENRAQLETGSSENLETAENEVGVESENCNVEEATIGLQVSENSGVRSEPASIIGKIRLRNMSEIIDASKFSDEPNALQSDVCIVELENLSEDAGGMSSLRTMMRYVAASPNLYSVLHDSEKVILKTFFALKQDYQYVCFKLFLRQPKWYNMVKFLKDINVEMTEDEIKEMFTSLKEQLFIETDYSKDPHIELLNNLVKEDVQEIFKFFKLKSKTTTKDALVEAILKHCSKQSTLSNKSSADVLLDKICDKMGPCVKLLHSFHHIIFRIHLLYSFTRPDLFKPYDLYNFMTAIKKGLAVLPNYTSDFMLVFRSKEEFMRFSRASEFYNEYMNAKEKDNAINAKELMLKIAKIVFADFKDLLKSRVDDASAKPNFLKKFTAGRVYAKTLSLACDDFRTNLDVTDWLELLIKQDQYSLGRRGDWYNRLAIMYNSHLKYDCDLVAQKVIEGLVDLHISTIDKHKLSERAAAIAKRKTKPSEEFLEILKELIIPPPDQIPFPFSVVDAKCKDANKGGKKLYIVQNPDGSQGEIEVEQVALNYYARKGYPRGIHIEGGLVITLFSLFFWDLIFDFYVPGTFISEIQEVPLDLYSKDFYANRKLGIDKRLMEIESGWCAEELTGFAREALARNGDKFTQLLSPKILQEPTVIFDAITCIRRKVIAKIFRRLLEDFRAYHSGMPDLFVWNADLKKCKFVEVKSENDVLSITQKLWLDYLRSVGANIEVCHVNSIGSKIKKGRRQ